MKPILVHVHVYYPELWPELKNCLLNIYPHQFKLYVTMVEDHSDIREDVVSTFADASVEIVENRGYDLWPFIYVLNKVNLDDYSYVIKLHTKRDLPNSVILGNDFSFAGDQWREELLKFISSKRNFEKCITSMQSNANIGCCASFKVIHPIKKYWGCDPQAREKFKEYTLFLNNFYFVAGTMFIVRAGILKTIQKMNIKSNLFDKPDGSHTIQFAHVMERTLGEVVYANKNYIKDVFTPFVNLRKFINKLKPIKRFFFQKKFTSSGHLIIKIIKIPVISLNYRSKNYKRLLDSLLLFHLISKQKYDRLNSLFVFVSSLGPTKELIAIIEKSKFFDKTWYEKQYPDVVDKKMNPAEHYLLYGWKEYKNPSKDFSTYNYLKINDDVKWFSVNPLLHYELMGREEKREIN